MSFPLIWAIAWIVYILAWLGLLIWFSRRAAKQDRSWRVWQPTQPMMKITRATGVPPRASRRTR